MQTSVRLQNITKRFLSGVIACHDVSCEFKAGEIHAILGENGAGKTTLMKVLAGFYAPETGYVEMHGQRRVFQRPKEAKVAGVGMVHQHFSLIPALTVAENLALGYLHTKFFLQPRRWSQFLMQSAQEFGFDIRPDAYVRQLSMGERQRVEIFRLLLEGARILILDEPTSILAPQEAEQLFKHLRQFATSGHTVLLVTHKIDHVKAIADRVTVLRGGRLVATQENVNLSESELAELMVGRPVALSVPQRVKKPPASDRKTAFTVQNLTVAPITSPCGLTDVSFDLRFAEILGIAGISGNGQDELVASLTGMASYQGIVPNLHAGLPSDAGNHQLGYIPGDRRGVGVVPALTVQENLVLRDYQKPEFLYGPFLNTAQLTASARRKIEEFAIRPADPNVPTSHLSGGNIQKILLARELADRPEVIIAVTPTAGLDIMTVDFVHREIVRHAEAGAAVLLVSEDLDELLGLCDRILVLFAGRVAGIFDVCPDIRSQIGLAMSGQGATGVKNPVQRRQREFRHAATC